jgi:hypothetical protein
MKKFLTILGFLLMILGVIDVFIGFYDNFPLQIGAGLIQLGIGGALFRHYGGEPS